MTSRAFRERLTRRARAAGLQVQPDIVVALETYFGLLTLWNRKVNLTALPLEEPTDETFDRLFIEPLAAARIVDDSWTPWIDVGSGGGSPAIPLKLVVPALDLTLVESKARKAAFLREVVRELSLIRTLVETSRFEELASRPRAEASAGLLTIRAVRLEPKLIKSMARMLRPGGRLLTFQPSPSNAMLGGFRAPSATVLHGSRSRPTYLIAYDRALEASGGVFHVEHSERTNR
jgi:16S rRNA (guanine527-N7)-methyltransferase